MPQPEDSLTERIRQGSVTALAAFIESRRPQLLAFVERQLGGALRKKLEPEDIVQELSTDAVRSIKEIDLQDRDPFNWLCQLAERRIIDAHRRFFGAKKRDAGREISLATPVNQDESRAALVNLLHASMTRASQVFSRNQREQKLMEALQKLPEDQREAIRLRYMEGLPSKEIATRLNKTDGAVRVMLTRTLNKLQSLLGPELAP